MTNPTVPAQAAGLNPDPLDALLDIVEFGVLTPALRVKLRTLVFSLSAAAATVRAHPDDANYALDGLGVVLENYAHLLNTVVGETGNCRRCGALLRWGGPVPPEISVLCTTWIDAECSGGAR